jgi:hypothetical protein
MTSGRNRALGAVVVFTAAASLAGFSFQALRDTGGDHSGGGLVTQDPSPGWSSLDSSSPEQAPAISDGTTHELTAEEDLAINPPPPRDIRTVGVTRGSVELSWGPPPSVSGTHHYSDRVIGYRIYRQEGTQVDFRPLALTAETTYVDLAVQSGRTYAYVISSVRERDVEGGRSDPPVTVTVLP